MKYLRIANPGVADPLALTLMGVGASRYSGNEATIGMFGSGSKLAAALLLRKGLVPVIMTGNLILNYGTKQVSVGGRTFHQVIVKYGGTRTATEDLGYTLEWGVQDWDDVMMAPREYLANAIDGCISQGLDGASVEIELVDRIGRARADLTQVFIPAVPEILKFYNELNVRFLHFARKRLTSMKLLPKVVPDGKTRIYKKGVLVSVLQQNSIFDYNLSSELKLDESRNADEWAVKGAVGKALARADVSQLANVFQNISADVKKEYLETELSTEYVTDKWGQENGKVDKANWVAAFKAVAGENGVASIGLPALASHVQSKGFNPFVMPGNWVKALEEMGCPTETQVLTDSEKLGELDGEPTDDMVEAVDDCWDLLTRLGMTKGRNRPEVLSFTSLMTAGAQKLGSYRGGVVRLHADLASKCKGSVDEGKGIITLVAKGPPSALLRATALEEVVHHVTGAGDMSRDIQDFLFNVITQMAWIK